MSSNCRVCSKRHNSLLHENSNSSENKEVNSNSQASNTNDKEEKGSVTCSHSRAEVTTDQVLLSTAIVRVKDCYGNFVKARALMDSGSQSNFISEELSNKLRLPSRETPIEVRGINQQVSHAVKTVNLSVSSHCNSFLTEMQCIVLPKITQNVPLIKVHTCKLTIPKNIRLADPRFHTPQPIDLLIGAERFWDLLCVGQISLGKNQPTLQKTLLGWIVAGRFRGIKSDVNSTTCNLSSITDLDVAVSKFWQVENYLDNEVKHQEKTYCEERFEKNHIRNAEGKFIVRLPLKEEVIREFGDSKDVPLRRFKSLEKRLEGNAYLKEQYIEFIREYLRLGHMRAVQNIDTNIKRVFLPHHAVVRDDKTTTKVRIVFDASNKDTNGISLNDALYNGPVVQSDLFSIILRFRFFKYVLCADIKKKCIGKY